MMGAMMLPSAAPMILTFAAAQARRDRNVAVPTWMFVAGYILVWGYAGVVVFVLVYAGKDLVDRFAWPERLTSAQSQLMALQQVLGNSRVTARGWNCDHASRVSAA
jgi:predicted metal-binding membrane protein